MFFPPGTNLTSKAAELHEKLLSQPEDAEDLAEVSHEALAAIFANYSSKTYRVCGGRSI